MTVFPIIPDARNNLEVTPEEDGMRLDSFLSSRFPNFTRAKIQRAISKQGALVNGSNAKSSLKLKAGQQVSFVVPEMEPEGPVPEDIPLDIVFEDEHLVGINKPPQMVVHPAKGHWSGTLTAALAFHFDQLSSIGGATRPGIVHRLDRDTSGIIIVAKTDFAHSQLSQQFEARSVQKKYVAIVSPPPDRDRDQIEQPIGAHPYQREKMAIRHDHKTSRAASTFYEVIARAGRFAKISVSPKTGRTHQIRVHLAHLGCPVVSDKLYSGHNQLKTDDVDRTSNTSEILIARQALHAASIAFLHPNSKAEMTLEAPLPADIEKTWDFITNQLN